MNPVTLPSMSPIVTQYMNSQKFGTTTLCTLGGTHSQKDLCN